MMKGKKAFQKTKINEFIGGLIPILNSNSNEILVIDHTGLGTTKCIASINYKDIIVYAVNFEDVFGHKHIQIESKNDRIKIIKCIGSANSAIDKLSKQFIRLDMMILDYTCTPAGNNHSKYPTIPSDDIRKATLCLKRTGFLLTTFSKRMKLYSSVKRRKLNGGNSIAFAKRIFNSSDIRLKIIDYYEYTITGALMVLFICCTVRTPISKIKEVKDIFDRQFNMTSK